MSTKPVYAGAVDRRRAPDELRLAAWRAFLKAHAAVIDRVERDLARGEELLPLTWYDVLLELAAAEGGRLRQRDLARVVVLTRSGISRLVDRLEAAGLLCRQPNPDDRRGDFLLLTDRGRAALRRTWPAYARGIQAHFARLLSDEEARTLAVTLERVVAAAREAPLPPPRTGARAARPASTRGDA